MANLKHSIQHENKNCFSWLNGAEEKDTYFDPMDIIPLFLQQKKKKSTKTEIWTHVTKWQSFQS